MSWAILGRSSSRSSTAVTCRPRSNSVMRISCSAGAVVPAVDTATASVVGSCWLTAERVQGRCGSARSRWTVSNYTWKLRMDITLPLDYTAIARILPHRYPFLLVDRITELVPDKRIVGIKNVTFNEPYLSRQPGVAPALPPTILTEAVAQVGAILILSKAENREKLIFFMGIDRVRYRHPVRPGDVVEIEARVKRLRSRMGQLGGVARVNGQIVIDGVMTFALGPIPA